MAARHPGEDRAPARWLAADPAKRAVERHWLRYTLLWGAVAATVMLGGWAERWGDVELMLLGLGFAAGAVLPPLLRPHPLDARRPFVERSASKMVLSVVGLSLLMNYFCTPYFLDVLHMHFGFATSINIQNNPLFLYWMTVAYFSTYSVLVCVAGRAARRVPPPWRWPALAIAPFAVAFLETLLNANPFMRSLFCFDDMGFMLWFGTLSYGLCFAFAAPLWLRIDEGPSERMSLRGVAIGVMAVMMAIVLSFELLRHLVAPHVTTVNSGANGLRDYDDSCLSRP